MDILNASDAKREFGELLIKVQREPVGINKNGKPIAVVLSVAEYEQLKALKEERLKAAIQEGISDLESGKVASGTAVVDRLRKRISQGTV
ncbi:type II toxin-antitoxin system Phd/YefM family antitoxin [Lacimicrobium alkaliphilum]|uniref:Antitoxin n=1 Tax=Lacimicrobium alkaliphilum TaxID=1526571 RepID=A0ABQ1RS33_9ALTE|nr:type II toxin-antitoxin system Phd/YefM family antitoxin [Lacimicrobium alkaliphilum]GGD75397.1 antitoxin [Lacimicrobium alkaliphilum]